jgi:hypothetical protein
MKALAISLLFFLAFSCKKNPEVDLGEKYFPITTGSFVVYDATEILHDAPSNINDTLRFQLKVQVGGEYVDSEGRIGREVKRLISNNDGQTWSLEDVWHSYRDLTVAELIEENQRRVKLVFPPKLNEEWNLNAQNVEDQKMVFYEDIDFSRSYGTQTFDSTLLVRHNDFFSLVDYIVEFEVYAKNVGLVQLYSKNLVIENFDTLDISFGQEKYYMYIKHGVE